MRGPHSAVPGALPGSTLRRSCRHWPRGKLRDRNWWRSRPPSKDWPTSSRWSVPAGQASRRNRQPSHDKSTASRGCALTANKENRASSRCSRVLFLPRASSLECAFATCPAPNTPSDTAHSSQRCEGHPARTPPDTMPGPGYRTVAVTQRAPLRQPGLFVSDPSVGKCSRCGSALSACSSGRYAAAPPAREVNLAAARRRRDGRGVARISSTTASQQARAFKGAKRLDGRPRPLGSRSEEPRANLAHVPPPDGPKNGPMAAATTCGRARKNEGVMPAVRSHRASTIRERAG